MTPHSPHVAIDRLTLLWRYSLEVMKMILDKATASIHTDGHWYYTASHKTGATARLTMMLPDQEGQLPAESADLRFWLNTPGAQQGCVRVEWNPAKAGPDATGYILQELGAFLPATVTEIPATAYVTRLDLAVDVPGITCGQLLALRISHHKRTEVFVGANGEVDSLRIGARGSSARTGTFLRVYDKHLPAPAGVAGVRAEIEVSRPGYLAAVEQIKIGRPREGPQARPGAALGRQGAHHRIQTILPQSTLPGGTRTRSGRGPSSPPRGSSSSHAFPRTLWSQSSWLPSSRTSGPVQSTSLAELS